MVVCQLTLKTKLTMQIVGQITSIAVLYITKQSAYFEICEILFHTVCTPNTSSDVCVKIEARFIRRTSHVPNTLKTIDNEAFQLIIYCL